MDAIDALRDILMRINSETSDRFELPIVDITRSHQKVQKKLKRRIKKNRTGPSGSDLVERIAAAVRRFSAQAEENADLQTLRLICLGCGATIQPDDYIVLGDPLTLARLLKAVRAWRDQPRIFRKFYYSLMKAYFTFQPDPRAVKPSGVDEGCRQLRDFLSATLETCLLVEPVSDWALTLREFPALLENQPQRAFADIVLTGDTETLRVVCEKLCLTGDTWLAAEAIRTSAAAVMAGQDAFFIENIAVLLGVFDEPRFASLRDEVLVKLLERYAAMHDRPVHVALRDFAVNAWKNPWLQANAPGWRRVSTDVRKMVASWLKLDLISQFFLLLSEDGKNDSRRFEFWRRYLDQIGDIYFVIGRRTQETRANEVLALREKLGARVLELAGGEPANNAFIMTIGESMVVEFSKSQNAAYVYTKESFSQKLSGVTSVDIWELKLGRTRLIHRDNAGQHWEDRFIAQLGEMRGIGVWPDDSPKIPPSKGPSSKPIPKKAQLSAVFDEEEFRRFVAKFELPYEDLRPEGGNLRVITNKSSRDALAQLKKWGFAYKPGKGWWKASTPCGKS